MEIKLSKEHIMLLLVTIKNYKNRIKYLRTENRMDDYKFIGIQKNLKILEEIEIILNKAYREIQ